MIGSQDTAAANVELQFISKAPFIGVQLENDPSRPVTHFKPARTGGKSLLPYEPADKFTATKN